MGRRGDPGGEMWVRVQGNFWLWHSHGHGIVFSESMGQNRIDLIGMDSRVSM